MPEPSKVSAFNNAEALRNKKDPKAINLYLTCLAVEGSQDLDLDCHHMLGVCYKNAGEYDLAIEHLFTAFKLTPSNDRKRLAHISRDLGEAYRNTGDFYPAYIWLSSARSIFTRLGGLEEILATNGFIGRVYVAQGNLKRGIMMLSEANVGLRAGTNRHYELYNLLHLMDAYGAYGVLEKTRAAAYKTAGQPRKAMAAATRAAEQLKKARSAATRALELALEYGGEDHQARARRWL